MALPSQFMRLRLAFVVEPRRLVRSMPVGALPHLAHPPKAATLPTYSGWLIQPVGGPCPRLCRVLKHSAPAVHRRQCSSEASAVVPWPVVFAAPSSVIHRRHRAPQLARRVGNHRQRPLVVAGIPRFVPCVYPRPTRVTPVRLYVERRHITRRFTRTFISLRFIHAAELCRYALSKLPYKLPSRLFHDLGFLGVGQLPVVVIIGRANSCPPFGSERGGGELAISISAWSVVEEGNVRVPSRPTARPVYLCHEIFQLRSPFMDKVAPNNRLNSDRRKRRSFSAHLYLPWAAFCDRLA